MSNYPDDIGRFNNDPRSPLYDDRFDVAVENVRQLISEQVFGYIKDGNDNGISEFLYKEYSIGHDYVEFIMDYVYEHDDDAMVSAFVFGTLSTDQINDITDAVVDDIYTDIVDWVKEH